MNDEKACMAAPTHRKHELLDSAINELSDLVEHSGRLLDMVRGPTPLDGNLGCGEIPPTLSEVLNDGPERIRGYIRLVHEQLEILETELF